MQAAIDRMLALIRGPRSNDQTNSSTTTSATAYPIGVSIHGSVNIESVPAGISCGSKCSAYFPIGSSVTLKAIGSGGVDWTGCTTASASSCTVQADSPRTVIVSAQQSAE
jgi:hypothetical protein